jgi:hypothetical protein
MSMSVLWLAQLACRPAVMMAMDVPYARNSAKLAHGIKTGQCAAGPTRRWVDSQPDITQRRVRASKRQTADDCDQLVANTMTR